MRFNERQNKYAAVVSYEGGKAYEKDTFSDWLNCLFSSYLENKYYESADKQLERFLGLTNKLCFSLGPTFVAKASVYARNQLGMRATSLLLGAYLNDETFDYKRNYYRALFHRPDDVAEVFAAVRNLFGSDPSHALVRGASDYLSSLSAYSLGKYKMKGHEYNIYDLINLCHPKSKNITALKQGTLKVPETWEVLISGACGPAERQTTWIKLVHEKKLGYLALIRNLRNIIEAIHEAINPRVQSDWIDQILCPQITNRDAIRKSLIFPYQIYSAYKQIYRNIPITVRAALQDAFIIATENTPILDGDSVIMLDVSGSMDSTMSARSVVTIKEVGACYAASLFIRNPKTTFIKFGTYAEKLKYYSFAEPFTLIDQMTDNGDLGYGTQVDQAFQELREPVDRIFLISDQQNMAPLHTPFYYHSEDGITSYKDYCHQYGPTHIFSFDLGNYKTQYEDPNNEYVHLLTSLNDGVQKMIPLMEEGEDDIKELIATSINLSTC